MGEKLNCWEFMQCGRGPGGANVEEQWECPAAIFLSSEELNGGTNGGRMCWAIAGLYSFDEVKKPHPRMMYHCHGCAFHWKVLLEEGIIKPGMGKGTTIPENSN